MPAASLATSAATMQKVGKKAGTLMAHAAGRFGYLRAAAEGVHVCVGPEQQLCSMKGSRRWCWAQSLCPALGKSLRLPCASALRCYQEYRPSTACSGYSQIGEGCVIKENDRNGITWGLATLLTSTFAVGVRPQLIYSCRKAFLPYMLFKVLWTIFFTMFIYLFIYMSLLNIF